jgi:hypothetical protein
MAVTSSQEWPSFDSPLLESVSEAFRSRRKAIRHGTKSFAISRDLEESPAEPPERLNADAETHEARPTQVRLSVWPDGALWFRACQPAKQGWAFLSAFHGQLRAPLTGDLVAWFEQSLALVHGSTRPPDCEQRLLSIWHGVDAAVENARRPTSR